LKIQPISHHEKIFMLPVFGEGRRARGENAPAAHTDRWRDIPADSVEQLSRSILPFPDKVIELHIKDTTNAALCKY